MNTDIKKSFLDGKAVILEGQELKLNLYVKKIQKNDEIAEKNEKNKLNVLLSKLRPYINNEKEFEYSREFINEINISNHIEDKFEIIVPEPDGITDVFETIFSKFVKAIRN